MVGCGGGKSGSANAGAGPPATVTVTQTTTSAATTPSTTAATPGKPAAAGELIGKTDSGLKVDVVFSVTRVADEGKVKGIAPDDRPIAVYTSIENRGSKPLPKEFSKVATFEPNTDPANEAQDLIVFGSDCNPLQKSVPPGQTATDCSEYSIRKTAKLKSIKATISGSSLKSVTFGGPGLKG